jgi:hypothetical protein
MSQKNKMTLTQLKQKKLELSRQKLSLKEGLPHLHGFPWYTWAREFFESTNETNLLCAANQISKSSTQIRKCIDWATDKSKWSKIWSTHPRQFWYLYPTGDVATIEFLKKWEPEFMPRGQFKSDEEYGWKLERVRGQVKAIHFNSGVSVYFKSYSQDVHHLQSGTVHAIFCDEELPDHLYDELQLRLAAVGGHFHMVFTATLNQDFWRRAIEPNQKDQELLRDAWKKQVSMWDCLKYEDGSPSPWTPEKIRKIESKCKSEAERQRRVYGRFITEEGRIYHAFDAARHYTPSKPVPKNWHVYSAVDIGSGGKTGHPSAIVFIAVRPDYRFGYVVLGWRGDGIPTTAGDALEKYQELRDEAKFRPVSQAYDWAAGDFGTIAGRMGESFIKAEKSHALGEDILNTLFKNDMLMIFDEDELQKLGGELSSLMSGTPKNKRKDDFADACRYCAVQIPWDFEAITLGTDEEVVAKPRPMTEEEIKKQQIRERRGLFEENPDHKKDLSWKEMEAEFEYWNEQYG